MELLFTAINAKYIHTNPAVRGLRRRLLERFSSRQDEIEIAEYTINHRTDEILAALYRQRPKILAFSCYLWNIGMVRTLCTEYKKIAPETCIVLGGPEVSYDPEQQLKALPAADLIICGEGEYTWESLYSLLSGDSVSVERLREIPGIAYREKGSVIVTGAPAPVALDDIPFCYTEEELQSGRILYYETTRGCPFQCQYCLSSAEHGVRYRSLAQVFSDLDRFLDAKVPQVKLVDRTFNCSKSHAMAIWKYLREHDNGITNFHFELAAELLDEEELEFLSTVRPGLFQFEIGVQSTNPRTLEAIKRPADLEHLKSIVFRIHQGRNIHQHLDLIAGLPYEDFASFRQSFNDVFAMKPQQLQLGFLKLLKGTGMHRDAGKYGIIVRDTAPYEVLFTRWISFEELSFLKDIEEMVEIYCNSGRFSFSLKRLIPLFETPFDFFAGLAKFWREKGYFEVSHRNEQYYELLWHFFCETASGHPEALTSEQLKWVLKYDLCLHQKPKRVEDAVAVDLFCDYKDAVTSFFRKEENIRRYLPDYLGTDPHQIQRICHGEVFPFHPEDTSAAAQTGLMVFDYRRRTWDAKADSHWFPLVNGAFTEGNSF